MVAKAMKIVIIGGSYAGFTALKTVQNIANADITLISAADTFWNNCGTPRVLVEPESVDKIDVKVAEKVKARNGKFVQGIVTAVDLDAQKITLQDGKVIDYDYVVVASGSLTVHPAFKNTTSTPGEPRKKLLELAEGVKKAKKIVVVGGGPTGVEVSSEIKYAYPDKNVTLYTGDKAPLMMMNEKRQRTVVSKMETLGVKVVNNVHVKDTTTSGGKVTIELDNGKTDTADLYIPAVGVKPNTGFLSPSLLNERGFIKVDDYLRIEGYKNAYALGDVISSGIVSVADLKLNQTGVIDATLKHDIAGAGQLKKYQRQGPGKTTMVVPTGKEGGVGEFSGWGLPSFMVKKIKSATFMLDSSAGDWL